MRVSCHLELLCQVSDSAVLFRHVCVRVYPCIFAMMFLSCVYLYVACLVMCICYAILLRSDQVMEQSKALNMIVDNSAVMRGQTEQFLSKAKRLFEHTQIQTRRMVCAAVCSLCVFM